MRYYSTRRDLSGLSEISTVLVSEAIEKGLAADGGLFVPENWPAIKLDLLRDDLKLPDFAYEFLKPFFENSSCVIKSILRITFPLYLSTIASWSSLISPCLLHISSSLFM